jgi:hypothetical protein
MHRLTLLCKHLKEPVCLSLSPCLSFSLSLSLHITFCLYFPPFFSLLVFVYPSSLSLSLCCVCVFCLSMHTPPSLYPSLLILTCISVHLSLTVTVIISLSVFLYVNHLFSLILSASLCTFVCLCVSLSVFLCALAKLSLSLSCRYNRIIVSVYDRYFNGRALTRCQCRKTAVLSCHRFLISSGV